MIYQPKCMFYNEHTCLSRIKIVSEDILEHTRQSLIELRVCQRGDEKEKERERWRGRWETCSCTLDLHPEERAMESESLQGIPLSRCCKIAPLMTQISSKTRKIERNCGKLSTKKRCIEKSLRWKIAVSIKKSSFSSMDTKIINKGGKTVRVQDLWANLALIATIVTPIERESVNCCEGQRQR